MDAVKCLAGPHALDRLDVLRVQPDQKGIVAEDNLALAVEYDDRNPGGVQEGLQKWLSRQNPGAGCNALPARALVGREGRQRFTVGMVVSHQVTYNSVRRASI